MYTFVRADNEWRQDSACEKLYQGGDLMHETKISKKVVSLSVIVSVLFLKGQKLVIIQGKLEFICI
jgi:hypothetical protein